MVDFNADLQYQIEKQDAGPIGNSQIYYLTLFALFGHITAVVLTFIIGKFNLLIYYPPACHLIRIEFYF